MSPASVNHVTSGSSNSTTSEGIIDKFLDAIWMERGLSTNTLGAYRADLMALQRWLAQRDTSLIYATRADLLAFIASRAKEGAKPRSTARQLSSFRRFYRFLLARGRDPGRSDRQDRDAEDRPFAAASLTEAEVESLLAAPEISDPLGHRDRAMLEVLYATGLRVSELINLKPERGQPEPGRAAHSRQGRSRATDSASVRNRSAGSANSSTVRAWKSCWSVRASTCFRPAVATA